MKPAIEIIQVGASGTLFQICDGDRFALVEFEEWDRANHIEQLSHPRVTAYLLNWLARHGALTGSQNPPYLEWVHVEMTVVAARAGERVSPTGVGRSEVGGRATPVSARADIG